MPKNGGTQMYCPNCKSVEIMRAISSRGDDLQFAYEGRPHGAYKLRDYPGVWVYHVARDCLTCSTEGSYWTIDDNLFSELLELKSKKEKIETVFSKLESIVSDTDNSLKQIKKLIER